MNHVKVFSQLARKLVNKNFRQSLFAAQDAAAGHNYPDAYKCWKQNLPTAKMR